MTCTVPGCEYGPDFTLQIQLTQLTPNHRDVQRSNCLGVQVALRALAGMAKPGQAKSGKSGRSDPPCAGWPVPSSTPNGRASDLPDLPDLDRLFAASHEALAEELRSFGTKRWLTTPPQHLHCDERVKLAFEYSEMVSGEFRRPTGTVVSLCWSWGINDQHTARAIYSKVRHGPTVRKLPRVSKQLRIMEQPGHLTALIGILRTRKVRA